MKKGTFDRFVVDFLVASWSSVSGLDVGFIAKSKMKNDNRRVPKEWAELAALELQRRGLGQVIQAKDGPRFMINEIGKIEALRSSEQMLEFDGAKASPWYSRMTSTDWGVILTGLSILVTIYLAK